MSILLHTNTASVVLTSCRSNTKFPGTRGTEKEHKKWIKIWKQLKIFYFYIWIFKKKCSQSKAFKNKCKRLKKFSYIHIHKYMVAVHSRKILWRNSLGQWDLSEGHSSQSDFLESLTEMRHHLLDDKEIHLSTIADLLPRLKKMKLKHRYF